MLLSTKYLYKVRYMKELRLEKAVITLSIITLGIFSFSLSNDFVAFDDDLLIYENPIVLEFNVSTLWRAFTTYDPELYVPLTILSYQVERALFGLNPFIFHLTNLLLHLGSVLLVFYCALKLAWKKIEYSDAFWVGLVCSIIFAIHPLNAEAVAWAAARKDILSSFFFFASFAFYIRYLEGEGKHPFIWSLVMFLLALGAKASVIMLPLILVLVDLWYKRKIRIEMVIDKIPFAALSVIFGIVAMLGKQMQLVGLSLAQKLFLSAKGSVFYVEKLIWPSKLNIFYPQEFPFEVYTAELAFYAAILVIAASLAIVSLRKNRVLFFGLAFYLLMLIPTFATFWKNGFVYYATDRYPYAAQFGLILILAFALVPRIRSWAIKNDKRLNVVACAGIALTVFVSFLTMKQLDVWKDSEALFRNALKYNPTSVHALNNLGTSLYDLDKMDEAIAAYDQAIEINSYIPQVHTNKGLLLIKQKKVEEAKREFIAGIENTPKNRMYIEDDLLAYYQLAKILDEQGQLHEAIRVLEDAAKAGDTFASSHYYLGIKYQQIGDKEGAYKEFKEASEIDKRHVDAHYRLAAVSAELGKLEEALDALKRVQRLHPGYEQTEKHLENLRDLVK